MKRREFIAPLGGAAAWPLAARAQQGERMRRIGVLMPFAEDNPVGQARLAAFLQGLQQLGWADGRNVRIDTRWGAGDANLTRKHAAELVAPEPDVVMAVSSGAVAPLREVTRSVPVVFAVVADAVGAGFVESLVRPGGNVSGFTGYEYAVSGKWLELLKEIVPGLVRALVLRDARNPAGIGQFSAIQASAQPLGVDVRAVSIHDTGEIERALTDFSRLPNGGLIVTPAAGQSIHRDLIITLAERLRLPAVYADPEVVAAGGLISYGPDRVDQFRRAADYVDRILKGEKPSDLPVQAPTKYELVINHKTAKALALEIPPTLLAIADEVIE